MLGKLWKIISNFLLLTTVVLAVWDGTSDQELQDEVHDAELLEAVQNSMKEYNYKHPSHPWVSRRKRAETGVCYPELGCFESSGPFGYLDALPSSPDEISTTFLLYPGRRRARSVTLGETPLLEVPFQNLSKAWEWATKGGFNTSQPTKILVHGFGSSCSHIWVYEMRSALMSVEDCNIVCVDWENGAILPNYVKAAANTRLVGKQLAMLLRGLEKNVGLSRTKMHLIGFSLGAHVAGFAGAELKNISRITGLDPAGPLFESQDPIARLDETDADFVDVIHSNGENLILGGLGSWLPMGHVDFYPNGGRMQNGCSNLFVGAVSDIIWSSAVEGRSLCNHRRAYKFFTDSVSPRCHFPAFPCDTYEDFLAGRCFPCEGKDCGNMGYYADKSNGRGQLFLVTRDEEPFCAHQYSVKIESSNSKKPVVNYGKIKITLVGDSDLNETFTLTKKDDEQLMPGQTLSKILVPHPIISEPKKVQILYQGYSGWLSSGLKRWRIDKVSLMDSSGKVLSVCKKGLQLESGVPVNLHLYPNDCQVPEETTDLPEKPQQNEIANTTNETSFIPLEPTKFIPTPVVKIGNEAIKPPTLEDRKDEKNSIFYQWQPINGDSKNELDSEEIESNRAFNTKSVRSRKQADSFVEIAEPVLKKQSNKNARAHNIDKPEITEPILGPTTRKNVGITTNKPIIPSKIPDKKSLDYYINPEDWLPSRRTQDAKNLKQDSKKDNPLRMIMMTVQFLPERLSKMFEQAERYARETLFPLISQHTPKFISNFIAPKQTRYVPLDFDAKKSRSGEFSASPKTDFSPPDVPIKLERTDPEMETNSTENSTDTNSARSGEKLQIVLPQKDVQTQEKDTKTLEGIPPNSKVYYDSIPSQEDLKTQPKETSKAFQQIPPNSKVYYDSTSLDDQEKSGSPKQKFDSIPPNSKVYYDQKTDPVSKDHISTNSKVFYGSNPSQGDLKAQEKPENSSQKFDRIPPNSKVYYDENSHQKTDPDHNPSNSKVFYDSQPDPEPKDRILPNSKAFYASQPSLQPDPESKDFNPSNSKPFYASQPDPDPNDFNPSNPKPFYASQPDPASKDRMAAERRSGSESSSSSSSSKTHQVDPRPKKLYVDLPVFDERDRGIRYIPVAYPDALVASEKITRR